MLKQNGHKRCGTCDQLFAVEMASCPHCREEDNVPLSDVGSNTLEEEDWIAFEGQIASLKKKECIGETRKDLIRALFSRAMEVRYKQPNRSRDLFAQVVAMDLDNYEARIKISWLDIRLGKLGQIFAILEPVIKSETSTPEQKKRAYNNICCSFLFNKTHPDIASAYIYAKKGLEVDDIGSDKLWENYATILINQCKYVEARDALKRAVILEPNSVFAQNKLEDVDKILKQQEKHTKKMEQKAMKENKENSFELVPWVKNSKKLFTKRASSSKSNMGNVQFC